jgi:hypothetical protein
MNQTLTIGGFWGQLVSSIIWLVSAALGIWVTPKASILAIVSAGFFIFPLTQMLLSYPWAYNLNWFFPALMVLLGAHYVPFATLYGMRMFLFLVRFLVVMGVVIAHYFSGTFSLSAWVAGLAIFVFGWIGRAIAVDGMTSATSVVAAMKRKTSALGSRLTISAMTTKTAELSASPSQPLNCN